VRGGLASNGERGGQGEGERRITDCPLKRTLYQHPHPYWTTLHHCPHPLLPPLDLKITQYLQGRLSVSFWSNTFCTYNPPHSWIRQLGARVRLLDTRPAVCKEIQVYLLLGISSPFV
jgi:hypothetical protein